MSSSVLRGNLINTIKRSCLLSCNHKIEEGLSKTIDRLHESGAPIYMLNKILTNISFKPNIRNNDIYRKSTAVVPFHHRFGHRLQRSTKHLDTNVQFNYPGKFKSLPTRFARYDTIKRENTFTECRHNNASNIKCIKNCVYKLNLSCGKRYIGETGKCFGDRLDQHLKTQSGKQVDENDEESVYKAMQTHRKKCNNCKILTNQCEIIKSSLHNKVARKLVESFHIQNASNNISNQSIIPTAGEIKYMKIHKLIPDDE
jgi:hypothetical protein